MNGTNQINAINQMNPKRIVITIDGPAGAGKTTVSKILARKLGYKYIDTGALYRGIALAAKQQEIDPKDDAALKKMCGGLKLQFVIKEQDLRLLLNGEDVSDHLRTPEITMMASAVSARPVIREYLLAVQRQMGQEKGAVFEGRDMGTVVFPAAEAKFYLDASHENRAMRRYQELVSDKAVTLEQVYADMKKRDYDDSHRELAPLKPAKDAVFIDSSKLTIDEVVTEMLSRINASLS